MRCHGSDARNLVRRDRHSQPRPADQECTIRLAVLDELGGVDGEVRVRGLVARGVRSYIVDGGNVRIFLEVGCEGCFVVEAGWEEVLGE